MRRDKSKAHAVLRLISGWPLVGRLWEVPSDALKEARGEVVSATIYATMPFWFLPLIGVFVFLQRPSVWSGLVNGELFVYAATLVGPLAYIITKRHGRFRVPRDLEEGEEEGLLSYPFPYGRPSFYAATIICVLSGLVFTLQRLRSLDQFKNVDFINEDGLVWLSILVGALATLLLFCVTAYRNMLDSLEREHSDKISDALKNDEDTAYDQWMERKTS